MYKITIEKIETKKVTEKEYQKLREPYDNEKEQDIGNKNDPQYGYVDVELEKDIKTIVLEQSVENLDIPEVIKAINEI